MRHLARAPRHHLSLVRGRRRSRRPTRGHARGLLARSRPCRAATRPKARWRFYADAARYLVDPLPVRRRRSTAPRAYRRAARRAARDRRFDLVVCDFLPPVVNLPERLPCPSMLFTHNVEAEIWRRHAETGDQPGRARPALRQQWRRMLRFEGDALRAVRPGAGGVRRRPRARSRGSIPARCAQPVHVVPDRRRHRLLRAGRADARRGRAHMVFTGSMDWLPNEDGDAVLLPRDPAADPRRRSRTRRCQHRRPRADAGRAAARPTMPGVEVTGRVDDVRPHIARGRRSTSCRCGSAAARG